MPTHAAALSFSTRVDHPADVVEVHRRAVAIRDRQRPVRLPRCTVGRSASTLIARCAPFERAGRQVDVGGLHRRRHFVDADVARRELHSDRVECAPRISAVRRSAPAPRRAASRFVATTDSSAYSSTFDIGSVCDVSARISIDESAGFTLRNDGGVGMSGGSRRAAVGDRRLHVLRRRIDVAIERELQRDLRGAFAAGRRHRIERRNRRKLFFERRRDRGRHRLGACARQRRADRNRREIDRRQIGHRQRHVRERAEKREAERQQSRLRPDGGRTVRKCSSSVLSACDE